MIKKRKRSAFDDLESKIVELIRVTSTDLPGDVEEAILSMSKKEEGRAQNTLSMILENIAVARKTSRPICQDTGTLIFYVTKPLYLSQSEIEKSIKGAIKKATKSSFLRPNTVCPITGQNPGNNLGDGQPFIHFDETMNDTIKISLMMKGGGCENVSAQYKLPDLSLSAGRDLNGALKCVIDAVLKAQGQGCAPGIIGVGIGGDRASSHLLAKKQLFRKLEDKNKVKVLEEAERKLFGSLNKLKIGPMGFGGNTTVLGVKIGSMFRIPASYFVSVAYMCWACRRRTLVVKTRK